MRTKFLAFAATALMLASCSNDEVLTPQDDLKDTPISIASAGVAELTTRAITEGQLVGSVDENVSISVWVEGSAEKYNANNVEWIHQATSQFTDYQTDNQSLMQSPRFPNAHFLHTEVEIYPQLHVAKIKRKSLIVQAF